MVFDLRALDGKTETYHSVEEMAGYYLRELKEVQPHGPYYFGGYSFGGTVAYEMALQLVAQGEEVALLAMFDTVIMQNLPAELKPNRLVLLIDDIQRGWFVIKKFLGLSLPKKQEYLSNFARVATDHLVSFLRGKKYVNPIDKADHDRWLRKPPAFQKVEFGE